MARKTTKKTAPRWDEDGTRLTDCCGAYSTFSDDGSLCCKGCWAEVPYGQGDGTEQRPEGR